MAAAKTITIRRERFYPHPPEHVWVALTDPHALAEWFEPNDHQPVAGHKFSFPGQACRLVDTRAGDGPASMMALPRSTPQLLSTPAPRALRAAATIHLGAGSAATEHNATHLSEPWN